MSRSGKSHASKELVLKAIIICDDFAFVTRANTALQRVGCLPEVGARWILKSWPVNVLHEATLAVKTLAEAVDAHLIVIPGSRAHSLSSRLRDWLERWAADRQIRDAALAVMVDGIETGLTNTVSPELTLLVQKHGLNLITDAGVVSGNAGGAANDSARHPGPWQTPSPTEKPNPPSARS
jgi:hypothetical protein